MDERESLGRATRESKVGDGGAGTDPYDAFAPEFAGWLFRSVWGDVYQQSALDDRTRSLVTVALIAQQGRDGPLASHLRTALRLGVTRDELVALFCHIAAYAGSPAAATGLLVLKRVMEEK